MCLTKYKKLTRVLSFFVSISNNDLFLVETTRLELFGSALLALRFWAIFLCGFRFLPKFRAVLRFISLILQDKTVLYIGRGPRYLWEKNERRSPRPPEPVTLPKLGRGWECCTIPPYQYYWIFDEMFTLSSQFWRKKVVIVGIIGRLCIYTLEFCQGLLTSLPLVIGERDPYF